MNIETYRENTLAITRQIYAQILRHNSSYQRITEQIQKSWGTSACESYLISLSLDTRPNRQGFPEQIKESFNQLNAIHNQYVKQMSRYTRFNGSDRSSPSIGYVLGALNNKLDKESEERNKEKYYRHIKSRYIRGLVANNPKFSVENKFDGYEELEIGTYSDFKNTTNESVYLVN